MTDHPEEVTTTRHPIPSPLLVWLHAAGLALEDSADPVLHHWGKHLLEDWRSLDLLDQRYEDR